MPFLAGGYAGGIGLTVLHFAVELLIPQRGGRAAGRHARDGALRFGATALLPIPLAA
jgi:hypothetical protein